MTACLCVALCCRFVVCVCVFPCVCMMMAQDNGELQDVCEANHEALIDLQQSLEQCLKDMIPRDQACRRLSVLLVVVRKATERPAPSPALD